MSRRSLCLIAAAAVTVLALTAFAAAAGPGKPVASAQNTGSQLVLVTVDHKVKKPKGMWASVESSVPTHLDYFVGCKKDFAFRTEQGVSDQTADHVVTLPLLIKNAESCDVNLDVRYDAPGNLDPVTIRLELRATKRK